MQNKLLRPGVLVGCRAKLNRDRLHDWFETRYLELVGRRAHATSPIEPTELPRTAVELSVNITPSPSSAGSIRLDRRLSPALLQALPVNSECVTRFILNGRG